jgi:light-regulated signal transduction histidine kinase (bacteriophytochrome)
MNSRPQPERAGMREAPALGTDMYARLRAPGRIQGFGAMLALHPRTLRSLGASENAGDELAMSHADLLGRPITEIITAADTLAELREALAANFPAFRNPLPAVIGGRRFDLVLHAHDGLLIAELEPCAPGAPGRDDLHRLTAAAITSLRVPETLDGLLQAAPRAIRAATGFDRVLLYKFDEAYRGQVIAESLAAGTDGFMGLFFPESDIGAPARQLYEHTFCRYIPDIDGATYRMIPAENPLTGRPLDMSRCILRAVAPCHIDYLRAMGVCASMSFSIVSEGRLWGLFACHHHRPVRLAYVQRLVCEQIAATFAAKLEQLVNPDALAEEMAHRLSAALSGTPILHADPLAQPWSAAAEAALLHLVEADGAAILFGGRVRRIGRCPDLGDLLDHIRTQPDAFGHLVRMYDDEGLFYSNAIAAILPFGAAMREAASGMMVIPLSRGGGDYLIWFRPELVVQATWAGNPTASHGTDPDAPGPARSFAAWKQDITDRAAPWTPQQIATATALRDAVMK